MEQRNPTAVVDLLLDRCLSYTSNMIQQNKACSEKSQQQQQQQQTQQQQQSTSTGGSNLPSLHFSVGMSTQSHISLQLVGTHNTTEPITSTNLLTLFATDISCNMLVKNNSSTNDIRSSTRKGPLEKQTSTSSTINCQALQLQIVTLNVSDCHVPVVGSSRLNFVLKLPSHASRIGIEMRDVVEMGVASAGGTVLGTTSNMVTSNILSSLSSTSRLPKSGDSVPTNTSRVATMLQLKEVWLQAATPHKSMVKDLSLACSFAKQWQLAASTCVSSIKKLLDVKVQQEKRVLAHVISDVLQQGGDDVTDAGSKVWSVYA